MHHLSYNISVDLIQLAEAYFSRDYIEKIKQKNTYEQSLVGRYLVSKIVEENWGIWDFLPRVDEEGRPVSLSFSDYPPPRPFQDCLRESSITPQEIRGCPPRSSTTPQEVKRCPPRSSTTPQEGNCLAINSTFSDNTEFINSPLEGCLKGGVEIFWSISHSLDHVFVGVSENPIGVDIETIRPRDESLFGTFSEQEWGILGEKNWESFYILWSAKEALVKKYLGGVDEIGKWQLIGVEVISGGVKKLSFSDGTTVEVVNSEVIDEVVRSWSFEN